MATLVTGSIEAVNNLADELARQMSTGSSGRATIGARDVAFSWTTGGPQTVAAKVNKVLTDGMSFTAIIVSPSGTPPALVTEGGTKPTAITLTSKPVSLKKFAGLAEFSTEDFIGTDSLAAAVTATLIGGALQAFDAAVVNDMEADAAATASGATWSAAILGGIGAVAINGGRANLLVMNPADYAAAVSPEAGYSADPTTGVPVLFGLEIVLSPAVTASTALVADSSAVTVAEHSRSPLVVADCVTNLTTNGCRIAAEIFAAGVVNSPAGVCVATKTA